MINVRMQQPTNTVPALTPKITVIGVGGAGGNAVDNMIASNLDGVEFLVCNTDSQALGRSYADNCMQIGEDVTQGLGAGARPEVGRAAAEESIEDIVNILDGSNMVFVTAGMGGGTGTGAAPVIAKACREKGILTVGVVTKPFHFEGTHRMKMADAGIEEMQKYVDTLIVIPNQNLFRVANEKTTFADAFKIADTVLQSGVRGVTDLMVRPGLINLDFADIRSAMMEMGKAMLGTGDAQGERRAIEAAEAAINNPLLDDVSMKGARGVIINVTGGSDMTLFEIDEACNRIRDEVDPNANIIFGSAFDDDMEGTMRVSVVATGIDAIAERKGLPMGAGNAGGMERARPNTTTSTTDVAMSSGSNGGQPFRSMGTQSTSSLRVSAAPTVKDESVAMAASRDMFEQSSVQQSATQQMQAKKIQAPLRGARMDGAFIPPAPVEPEQVEEYMDEQMYEAPVQEEQQMQQQRSGSLISRPSITEEMEKPPMINVSRTNTQSLRLRPPVPGGQKKEEFVSEPVKTPSLFERITGTVRGATSDLLDRDREESLDAQPQMRASKKRETLETPSRAASSASEDELDIPAFLRRQAN